MPDPALDLDQLAESLKDKMAERGLSLRAAAEEIGCSASTLSRLLQGSKADTIPDTKNVIRAVSWLGKSLSDFDPHQRPTTTTLNDVFVHLRALPGMSEQDREMLVNLLRAAHASIVQQRQESPSQG